MFLMLYIYPILFLSPLLSISSNSWFAMWMMMELNLMAFIPMIIFNNKYNKELSMKYFLIQTFSSMIFILMCNSIFCKMFNHQFNYYIIFSLNLTLLIKMGAAPFHNWFINLMKNLNWTNCFILSTWQKIIPMIIIMYVILPSLIYLSILISAIMGSFLGLNHQSIRLLLSYSSINHISWMLMNMLSSETLWIMYFSSYFMINLSIMKMFKIYKIFYLNQLYSIMNLKLFKINLFINFISISGLPPMFGFLMKFLTINLMIYTYQPIMMTFLIMMSILNFTYYSRILMIMTININLENKMLLLNKFNMFYYSWILISMLTLTNLWFMNLWMY